MMLSLVALMTILKMVSSDFGSSMMNPPMYRLGGSRVYGERNAAGYRPPGYFDNGGQITPWKTFQPPKEDSSSTKQKFASLSMSNTQDSISSKPGGRNGLGSYVDSPQKPAFASLPMFNTKDRLNKPGGKNGLDDDHVTSGNKNSNNKEPSGKLENDNEGYKERSLGLIADVDDVADDIGPPKFRPLKSLERPSEPSKPTVSKPGKNQEPRPSWADNGKPTHLNTSPNHAQSESNTLEKEKGSTSQDSKNGDNSGDEDNHADIHYDLEDNSDDEADAIEQPQSKPLESLGKPNYSSKPTSSKPGKNQEPRPSWTENGKPAQLNASPIPAKSRANTLEKDKDSIGKDGKNGDNSEDEDDDEKPDSDLGLISSVFDETDDIGPPEFKPLESLGRPSKSKPVVKPEKSKPSWTVTDGTQRPTSSQKPSLPKPDSPEDEKESADKNTDWKIPPELAGLFPSLSGSPLLGDPTEDSSGRPRTPSGKLVGTPQGKRTKIIGGEEHQVTTWSLNAKEILEMEAKLQGDLTMVGKFSTDPIGASNLDTYKGSTKSIELFSFYKSAYKNKWNDPQWELQWYMHDYRTKEMPVMDMNVVPAWELGYTGKNIKIALVDDGVQHGHPDLAANHLEDMSYDYSLNRPGSEPIEPLHENSHGTKCASQISMVAGNGLCGVGMAYDAKIAGVRNNAGRESTEFIEGKTLAHRLDEIDISSNSYGPKDDGIFMQRAPHLTYEAFLKGVTEGRGGRGQVYVFPAGNGKKEGDHCGADSYMNTRYTIGIAAANQRGKPAEYSERCAGILAATYSSGGPGDERVVSVEMAKNCNDTFGGTSAAVPHASAVIALILQANPKLTYRDVMHIITMGAEVAPLADNEDTWKRNGAGFWVSHDFGFGLLNAKNMVLLAENWKHVHVEHNSCDKRFQINSPVKLLTDKTITVGVDTDGCPGKHSVQWIENVELEVTIHYGYRGALSLSLTSPYGTVSDLLESRRKDNENGMRKWIFRTVHHWGERPNGRWLLSVTGNALEGLPAISGSLDEAIISFHGMARDPPHHSDLPRTYAAFRLPDGQSSQDELEKRESSSQDELVENGSTSEDELEQHGRSSQNKNLNRRNSFQGELSSSQDRKGRERSAKPDRLTKSGSSRY